jgi:adenylate kinase
VPPISTALRLSLLGKPGAGKSTQGTLLSRRLGIPLISTGALLRRRAAVDDADGRRLADALARGELVDDDVVVPLLNKVVGAGTDDGYLLDGFPRTLSQAQRLDGPPVDHVIELDVPDDVARQRLGDRAVGRPDDTSREVTERRLRLYHTDTEPVLELYRRRAALTSVDATLPPDVVAERVVRSLGAGVPSPVVEDPDTM